MTHDENKLMNNQLELRRLKSDKSSHDLYYISRAYSSFYVCVLCLGNGKHLLAYFRG